MAVRMTSPAITKSPENLKKEKKSPSHSTAAEAAAPRGEAPSAPPSEHFGWLRIFKLADLMMKQGC